jgi:hypothetical protein
VYEKYGNPERNNFEKADYEIHKYVTKKWGDFSKDDLDKKFFRFIESHRIRRDGSAQTKLVSALLKINDAYRNKSEHLGRDLFLNVVLESNTVNEFMKNLQNLELLVSMFPSKISSECINKEAMSDFDRTIGKHVVSILEIPKDFKGDVFEFYKTFRQPNALLKYMSKIDSESIATKKSFVNFICNTIDGTFIENRYKLENSPHLRKVFAKRPNLLKEWIKGDKIQKKSPKDEPKKEYSVEDTDNPTDLFLIGTEVDGSCQSVDTDWHYNKCLMAYVIDGKDRAILVRDNETKKIQSRSMLRILWDERGGFPVLLLEKRYSAAGCPNESMDWIKEMALKRAKKLQIPLVSKYYENSKDKICLNYPRNLKSYGSPALYEYIESKGISDGRFVEKGSTYSVLYNPPEKPRKDIASSVPDDKDNERPIHTKHILRSVIKRIFALQRKD